MAAPVTHVLAPMILLEVYRRYIHPNISKKQFPYWIVFLGGIFGALPDIDIVVGGIISKLTGVFIHAHRTYSHSFLIVIPMIIIGLTLFLIRNKISKTQYYKIRYTYLIIFVAAFGITMHILLDHIDGMRYMFYPFTWFGRDYNWFQTNEATMTFDGFMLILWLLLDKRVFEPTYNYFARKWFGKKYVIK